MQLTFSRVVRDGLEDANSEAIFGAIEVEHFFTRQAALFLLPLKQFFDLGVFDHRHTLVKVEKPLNNVRQRVIINGAELIAKQHRLWRRRGRND